MHRSRQSNPLLAVLADRPRRAFTLIELIFVLVLLAIGALFVTSNMTSFFRGRVLNFEARRMLSLTHYAQSRAVSEGVPMILWINPTASTYGLSVQSSFNDPGVDTHAVSYKAESSLTFAVPTGVTPPVSEQDDERLGINDEAVSFIRFTPDGFFDDSSVTKIIIRAGSVPGLELVPMVNRLAYELRPESLLN
jgi:prepilin-type N-terminal cleavage/methylation domain-containing protein